jgi:hypothetical protein
MIAQAAFMPLLRRLDRIATGWHRLMMPKQTALPRIPVTIPSSAGRSKVC